MKVFSVRAAKMVPDRIVTFPDSSFMESDPFLKVVHLKHILCIMDLCRLAYVSVGDTVIALVRGEVNVADLLDFGPGLVHQLVRADGKRFKKGSFHGLEKLPSTGLLSLEKHIVVLLQKLSYLHVQIPKGEKGHLP